MAKREKQKKVFKSKIIYTGLILLIYVIGRGIPLYGVDVSVYANRVMDAEELLMHSIGGDTYQYSLLALGISPYMISSIFVQIFMSLTRADERVKISKRKVNRISLEMTLLFAISQALLRLQKIPFLEANSIEELILAQAIAVIEMVTGAILIIWLSDRNKRYGIGGQTALIFVNIIDGIIATLKGSDWELLLVPAIVAFVVMCVTIVMENAEKRISVQRISIHNIYADKNYLAIKLNPIGVMPAMFSTAFFMIPQVIVAGVDYFFPNHNHIMWLKQNLVLTSPVGIGVYIFVLYFLTIVFSRVFINPKDVADNLAKGGDSIENLHAGRDTRKYLSRELNRISFFSSTIMSICMGIPLYLQLEGDLDSALMMLPSSIMMMTGIWCNLYQEIKAVRNNDSYRPFI